MGTHKEISFAEEERDEEPWSAEVSKKKRRTE
jgi:hypothetical protein